MYASGLGKSAAYSAGIALFLRPTGGREAGAPRVAGAGATDAAGATDVASEPVEASMGGMLFDKVWDMV